MYSLSEYNFFNVTENENVQQSRYPTDIQLVMSYFKRGNEVLVL